MARHRLTRRKVDGAIEVTPAMIPIARALMEAEHDTERYRIAQRELGSMLMDQWTTPLFPPPWWLPYYVIDPERFGEEFHHPDDLDRLDHAERVWAQLMAALEDEEPAQAATPPRKASFPRTRKRAPAAKRKKTTASKKARRIK